MSARMVLIGPPGAGKGTQAARLAEHFGVPAISTGDLFRTNIADGTALGRQVAPYAEGGLLVPDELTDALVADRLAQADAADGFILDGYPRNPAQVQALDALLEADDTELDVAVEITAPVEVVVQRLLGRAAVEGRADDTEDVIRRRMAVYAEQTAPLAETYISRGILAPVDGIGGIDEVTARLVAAIEPYLA